MPSGPSKMQILASKLENLQKSPLKHYIEKPYLPSFVNLSTTFCPRLCEETNFHSRLQQESIDEKVLLF